MGSSGSRTGSETSSTYKSNIYDENTSYHKFTTYASESTSYFQNKYNSNLNTWEKNLSVGSQLAIEGYTGTDYIDINKGLNTTPLSELDDWIIDSVKDIDKAISNFELNKPIELRRESNSRLLGAKNMSFEQMKALEGKIVQSNMYLSSSAKNVGGGVENIDVDYILHVPPGKGIGAYIATVSEYQSEAEFLFGRNSRFKVDKVSNVNGRPTVELTYVGRVAFQVFKSVVK